MADEAELAAAAAVSSAVESAEDARRVAANVGVACELGENAGAAADDCAADASSEGTSVIEDAQALAEHNALARVFDDVRAQSRASCLVQPARWVELGLVPEHMSAEDFEMLVYDFLETWKAEHAEEAAARGSADVGVDAGASGAPGSAHATGAADERATGARPASRFASRSVGVPRLFGRAARDGKVPELEPMPETVRSIEPPRSHADDEAGLVIPEGYELVELEGEWVLVETGEAPKPRELEIDAAHIAVLVGARSYYLYDASAMTDTYAHWAFLAAEDNPLVTFADCVREESRTYPRPMARVNFANEPFFMSADAVEAAWEQAQQHVDYADLARVAASNGDVYFYSRTYLSDARAKALAEWDAVERYLNV